VITRTPLQQHRFTAAALLASVGAVVPLAAQTASPRTSGDVTVLEKFEVGGVPIEQQILPTSRPFNSVFGTDMSILETPRNVTIISREQLSAIAIQDVRDFSKLTSSSYTRTNFGAPGNPDIRGQSGDVFVNGIRERVTSNGNGMPIDFNSVESVNIVKGPATAVQGVSTYVGGFVDLITKRPYFDQSRGSTFVTVGSYSTFRWGADFGGPLSNTLAYRVSYAGEDSEGYYYDQYAKKHSLYGALTYRPNQNYELFLNAQAFYAEYVENFGVNRPTQRLIDDGYYLTGVNNNPAPVAGFPQYFTADGTPIIASFGVPAGPAAPMSDPQNSRWVTSGFPVSNRMAYGPEVKLDRRLRLLRPGNNSMGRNFKVQGIQTFKSSPELTVVNNSLFTYTRRDTLSSYHYSEIIDPSYTIESRLEFQQKLGAHSINYGAAARFLSVKAWADFFFEPAAVWDITRDRNFINAYNSVNFAGHFAAATVPGSPDRYGSTLVAFGTLSGADGNISHATTLAPFAQANWRLAENLTLTTGARVDFMDIYSRDPFTTVAEDDIRVALPNGNVSLGYSFSPTVSGYATYNYSENTSGAAGNGGGYVGFIGTGPGGTAPFILDKSAFTQPSELKEVGMKFSVLGGKLFLGTAAFEQTRQNKPQNSPVATYRYRGFEFEANYQPSKRMYATFSYALIDGSVPAASIGFEALNVTPAASPEVRPNTQTTGRVRVQGAPRNQLNALLSYKFDSGFGFSLNGTYTTEMNNNWAGTLVIPNQYQIDAGLTYTRKTWGAQLTVLNATDEENWSPPNGVYGNESILAEPGIRGELTVTLRF
jgi:outer membrane receptor protein involved in Fe transport